MKKDVDNTISFDGRDIYKYLFKARLLTSIANYFVRYYRSVVTTLFLDRLHNKYYVWNVFNAALSKRQRNYDVV